MRFFLLGLIVFLSPISQASFWASFSIVAKVRSGVKGQPPRYVGSGFTFLFNNEVYILTSDHVIARQNGAYVHTVSLEMGTYEASYVAADWGHRFALLKLLAVSEAEIKYKSLSDFSKITYRDEGWEFFVLGFPANADEPVSENTSNWKMTKQFPDIAFQVPALIESAETHAEFGMSGGGVFNPVNILKTDIVGIISHQVYNSERDSLDELQAGMPLASNHILAIPFSAIQGVILDILKTGTSSNWNFYEQIGSNRSKEIVDSGALTLTLDRDQVTGIGEVLTIRIFPLRSNVTTLYSDSKGWLKKINDQLTLEPTSHVQVTGFRNTQTGVLQPLNIRSISEFLRQIESDFWEPVVK